MARTTQRKGDIALARSICTFTEKGYDVSLPITESAEYDLVVDTGEALFRVQCKFVNGAQRYVDLRKIHSNSKGYVVKAYSDQAYDWLYVYSPKYGEYLFTEFITSQGKMLTEEHQVSLGAEDK